MRNRFQYSLGEMTGRLLGIAAPVRKELTISTLASVVGNLSQMGLMGFGALALLRCTQKIAFGSFALFLSLMVLAALLIVLCRYTEGVVSHGGAYSLLAHMRVALFEKIRVLAPACLMDREKGDVLNIAVSDIETIEFFFAHTIGPMFTVILLPCVTLGLALAFDPLFAGKAGRGVGMRYRQRLGKMKSLVLESVYGLKDIQIFGYGAKRLETIRCQNEAINQAAHGLTIHRQVVSSAPTFFVYLARILVIAVASYLATHGSPEPVGTIVLSFVATASFSSTQSLTTVVSSLLETYAAAERLFLLEDTQPAVEEMPDAKSVGKIETVEFDKVKFYYNDDQRPILQDFDLRIQGAEKVGIVGQSGIGKSTVLRLLLRFWNPKGGQIRINGTPVEQLSLAELRRRIAVVEQDTFLFSGSIAQNIALGKPEATMEQIRQAARRAGIHEFIETLPQGYDTPMGQMGARLSGGERQRIGIARTMVVEPDVLVMDEPTSSLDVLHEKELLYTLARECGGQMQLIVSHRPSTLTGCTRIVRLQDGRPEAVAKESRA